MHTLLATSSRALGDSFTTLTLTEWELGWDWKGVPNLFSFSRHRALSLFWQRAGISGLHQREFSEIKKLLYHQYKSSIILLPSMSGSWLFTLTLTTANLSFRSYLRLSKTLVLALSPSESGGVSLRAAVEFRCRHTVDRNQMCKWPFRWNTQSTHFTMYTQTIKKIIITSLAQFGH